MRIATHPAQIGEERRYIEPFNGMSLATHTRLPGLERGERMHRANQVDAPSAINTTAIQGGEEIESTRANKWNAARNTPGYRWRGE